MEAAQFVVALLGGIGGTILLLMPGYVMSKAFARGVRSPELTGQAWAASTAIGGVVTHALFLGWTLSLFASARASLDQGTMPAGTSLLAITAWVFVVLLVAPALVGAVWARLTDSRWKPLETVFAWLGFSTAKRTAEAWIWAFHEMERQKKARYMLVRLKDGTKYLGTFGEESLASSDARVHDVFLEAIWPMDQDENCTSETPLERSVWVAGDSIAAIEFLPPKEEKDND